MGSIVTTGLMGVVLVLILILFLNALGKGGVALAHLKNHLGVELAGAGEGHHTAVNHKGGRGALQAGLLILFLNALGNILVKKELVTRDASRRGIISIVLFAVIFYCADFVLQMPPYDINIEAIKFLSAVIGAGCYWIGSRR